MSTLREHIEVLQAIAQKGPGDANNRDFAFHANLTLRSHLPEVAALLDAVAKPAPCAGRLIAGLWQCDHCGYFDLEPPRCAHGPDHAATAPATGGEQPAPAADERAAFEAWAAQQGFNIGRDDTDKYREYHRATTRWAWLAWQERAALNAPASPAGDAQAIWRAIGEEAECMVQGGTKYLLLSEEMCVRLGGALGL